MSDTNSNHDSHAGARHFCQLVRARLEPEKRTNVFVAGCGLGHEALHIRKSLGVPVTGVDIEQQWEDGFGADVPDFQLSQGSILDLPFADDTFDTIFYHHVIEHVADPARSLNELARVLVPGGLIYVGTPNRHRAVGYIGSSTASPSEIVKWNIGDYRDRLRGKFRNELGAHAGFAEKELNDLLGQRFTDTDFLTSDYLNFKYGGRLPRAFLRFVCARPVIEMAAPAVYAVARKPAVA